VWTGNPAVSEVTESRPEQWKVRSKLVLCYLDLGKVADARSEAEQKAIRKDPDAGRIQAVLTA
jgi:Flp pilus assembly protein TadD